MTDNGERRTVGQLPVLRSPLSITHLHPRPEAVLSSTRILVVEDDTRTADLIALYLRHAGHKVWTVGDGGVALTRLRDESWDAVILDRMLPGADGLAVCRVAAAERDVPVIFVSALTLEEERLAGFGAGGDDYITKPFSPRELVARVAAVLRRRGSREHVLSAGALRLAVADRRAEIAGVALDLTPSEYEILRALAERPGRSVARDTLLDCLPRNDRETMPRTIDVHVRNLRKKLADAAADAPVRIESVLGIGYRLIVR